MTAAEQCQANGRVLARRLAVTKRAMSIARARQARLEREWQASREAEWASRAPAMPGNVVKMRRT